MSSIGEVAKLLGVSTHTLRYYEKIGLLPLVDKSAGGRRNYGDREIERVRFIKRAKRMHFTLEEIRTLIELDKAPITEKPQVQRLVQDKLLEVEEGLFIPLHYRTVFLDPACFAGVKHFAQVLFQMF